MGLSPRVRGNPVQPGQEQHLHGSIPACAGEPPRCSWARTHRRVYPRVCGGTGSMLSAGVGGAGLSPRVRGNHKLLETRDVRQRSIPACAGEPNSSSRPTQTTPVYPRVCGGTRLIHSLESIVPGLSPRVRGNRRLLQRLEVTLGSIPACAGEPFLGMNPIAVYRVYPACAGEPSALARL